MPYIQSMNVYVRVGIHIHPFVRPHARPNAPPFCFPPATVRPSVRSFIHPSMQACLHSYTRTCVHTASEGCVQGAQWQRYGRVLFLRWPVPGERQCRLQCLYTKVRAWGACVFVRKYVRTSACVCLPLCMYASTPVSTELLENAASTACSDSSAHVYNNMRTYIQ